VIATKIRRSFILRLILRADKILTNI
jgi:hypothetical protein